MLRPFQEVRRSLDRRGPSGVYALLLVQQLMASGTHIIAKVAARSMDAPTLTLTRSLISAVLMGLILLAGGRRIRIAREDRRLVLFLSFLAIPVNQFFFLYGMRFTIPSNAALLYATTPILVVLFSWMFLKERLTRWKAVGVALGFAGVVILIFERGLDASMDYVLGNLLIARYGAIQASSITLILGTVMFVPVGLFPMLSFPFGSLSAEVWGEILYLSIITSVFSYFLWYFALSRIEAGKAALFANLQPLLTTVLAVVLLGQNITPAFVAGGTIALSGVIVAQFG